MASSDEGLLENPKKVEKRQKITKKTGSVHRFPKRQEAHAPVFDVGDAILVLRGGDAQKRQTTARLIGDMAFMKKEKFPEAVLALTETLKSDCDDLVREEAAWALWKLEDARAADALIFALSNDVSIDVRGKAARALGLLGVQNAVQYMVALLSMGRQIHSKLRAALCASLGLLGDDRALKVMLQSALDPEPIVRCEAVKSLGRFLIAVEKQISEKAFAQIVKSLNPRRERVAQIRQSAIRALKICNDPRAIEHIARAAQNDPDPETRKQAIEALLCFDGAEVEKALINALEDSNWTVRKTAGLILAEFARRSRVHNTPRVCEALSRMERMFPSGSREWRLAAMAFANL